MPITPPVSATAFIASSVMFRWGEYPWETDLQAPWMKVTGSEDTRAMSRNGLRARVGAVSHHPKLIHSRNHFPP